MRNLKKGCTIILIALLSLSFVNAQDTQPTMFAVHVDNVKFKMMPKYEELAKELKETCEKNSVKDANWTAISAEDGKYYYVTPITGMADLDKNPMGNLGEKIGNDKLGDMFSKMDDCYDSHSDYIIHHSPEMSYMPEGYNVNNKNSRQYHFLYYSPKDAQAMKKAIADVKAMYKEKGIKNGYNIYHSGFGTEENYYMVEIAGEDLVSIANSGKENDKIMGEKGDELMFNVISLASRYDKINGNLRPDLSYNSSGN